MSCQLLSFKPMVYLFGELRDKPFAKFLLVNSSSTRRTTPMGITCESIILRLNICTPPNSDSRLLFLLLNVSPYLPRKRGSSVVSALASGARDPGFDPRRLVSEHASLRAICRDDMNTVRRPYTGSILMHVGSSCKPECTMYASN